LPQQYSSAKIIVVDKSGKVLKEVNVSVTAKEVQQLMHQR
jgi:predicted transcriptional regulator